MSVRRRKTSFEWIYKNDLNMKLYPFFLLFSFITVLLISYSILGLNSNIVEVDLLFLQLDLSLGAALLSFFMTGFILTFLIEFYIYLRSRNKKNH